MYCKYKKKLKHGQNASTPTSSKSAIHVNAHNESAPIKPMDPKPYDEHNKLIIEQLQQELKAARDEISELKKLLSSDKPRDSYSPANSDEEEELVARETDWLLPKNKKRKAMSSPEKPVADIQQPEESNQKSKPKTEKKRRPPPIIVSNLENYSTINQKLKTKNLNYTNKLLNNNQLKINAESEDDFREVTKFANEQKIEWHTYENKQTRPIRVMVRDLHPSCKPEDIKEELLDKGFKILEVVNKIKKAKVNDKIVRTPLPLFMLSFENGEDIRKIYSIQYICHLKVRIEALRTNKLIPQCKRCQRFGHTHKFCSREASCVKCAGQHLTVECKKSLEEPPKCSNCGKSHPANYRGCAVAKELQKLREHKVKDGKSQNKPEPRQFTSKRSTNEVSYAQAIQARHINNEKNPQFIEQQSVMHALEQVMKRLDIFSERMDRLESRYTGTIPKRPV